MFRYLVVVIPAFRLERCGWAADQPVVLVDDRKGALRVQSATESARRKGVEDGMSLSTARTLIPELEIEVLDAAAERKDLKELAAQLLRISPSVTPLPPDTVVAEISRIRLPKVDTDDSTGRERALLERTRIRLSQLGHRASIAIADDPETARSIARWSTRNRIIAPGESRSALRDLPIASLSLPATQSRFLNSLGIRTVGEFAELPASAVATRMGDSGVTAHVLARGRSLQQPIAVETDTHTWALSRELPDPVIRLDALLFVSNALLRDLCVHLSTQSVAAGKLSLHFGLEEGQQTVSIRLGAPTRSPERILRQLRHRLSRISLVGPVTAVTMTFGEITPFDGQPTDLMNRERRTETIADVAARLQDSLGSHQVSIPEIRNHHRPETRWFSRPIQSLALHETEPNRKNSTRTHCLSKDPVHHWQGKPERVRPNRPPLMLPSPRHIDVRTCPAGMPIAVRIDESWIKIMTENGPERIETEWWTDLLNRDYWHVRFSDGRHAWIYEENGRWALHGWWDR